MRRPNQVSCDSGLTSSCGSHAQCVNPAVYPTLDHPILKGTGLFRDTLLSSLVSLADLPPPPPSLLLGCRHLSVVGAAAVLEVILSALDRDLVITSSAAAALAAACQQQHGSSSNSRNSSSSGEAVDVGELLSAVGRYPAGYAPAAASSDELQEAFRVLQVS